MHREAPWNKPSMFAQNKPFLMSHFSSDLRINCFHEGEILDTPKILCEMRKRKGDMKVLKKGLLKSVEVA